MKKILGIFVASAAALGSAMISAPAHAQTATLPVQVEITPAIFLRTYSELRFTVSPQDLRGGRSVDQDAGIYNEKAGITPLVTTAPSGTSTDTVAKSIPRLYQVWGNNVTADNIEIAASQPTLTSGTSGTGFPGSSETVTMSATKGTLTPVSIPGGGGYQEGSATLNFKFANPNTTSGTYSGGVLTIRVTNP
ncbi:hypothetical protein [Rivularia sp. UHCC 0363]|uniref:hypothetical protein n=1 Tax=Rivularia sp. UHCC 0363 TaxID=3110244 RepID=UPI002B203462|nr:hypothetical protein [Rivularia sp. UHCC 0363]MEA5593962.1 hypothetical protein [Rivularia sp. UHCC 0363]